MTTASRARYAGHRFPPETISHTVWLLYFRFPLSLRRVEDLLATLLHGSADWQREPGGVGRRPLP